MNTLDMTTAMLIGMVINMAMAVIILITARQFPLTAARSQMHWAVALVTLTCGYIIFTAFYHNGSKSLNILGHLSVVCAVGLMSHAVAIYLKTNHKNFHLINTLVSALLFMMILLSKNDSTAAIIISTLAIIIAINCCAKPMLKATYNNPTTAKIILVLVCVVFEIILVIRSIDYFYNPRLAWNLDELTRSDPSIILVAAIGPVIATFGFMLMHQEKAYAKMKQIATIDGLTKVFNRHAIEIKARELFKTSFQNNTPISIMVIDLDKFKSINDHFGHAAGDKALKIAAQIIRNEMKKQELVGRFGGEEFFVVLPGSDIKAANSRAKTILNALRNHQYQTNQSSYQITASIGIAERTSKEQSFTVTLKRADQAMYNAKKNGRNQVVAV